MKLKDFYGFILRTLSNKFSEGVEQCEGVWSQQKDGRRARTQKEYYKNTKKGINSRRWYHNIHSTVLMFDEENNKHEPAC